MMGYCYTRSGALCCDNCGASGGVKKRTCPYTVEYFDSRMSPRSGRLPYCSPSALCAACYAKHKATLHADCQAGAARSTARNLAIKAKLDAGELQVKARWGSWHATVPEGMIGVYFKGWDGEAYRLVPATDTADWLSDYPNAVEWPDHPQ